MGTHLNNLHSLSVSVLRGTRGLRAGRTTSRQPVEPLELYEFESCPFCRKVREVLSELDLSYVCHPCARGSSNRAFVKERGGKVQVPFLVDRNTGRAMYESEDIITYLHETYGSGRSTLSRVLAPLNTSTSALASLVRPRGRRVHRVEESRSRPAALLELYNFEASPYCRKVREVLAELDLDYRVHNVAKTSARRPQLVERGGRMMVPYLIDPNTDVAMYESDEIIRYLRETYGRAPG